MHMRLFGKRSGFDVPRVNIGAMRLPADEDEAIALIRHAIDRGMRYIDTSRGYGDSEIKVGKALKDGYREKVILSTKWAPWVVKIEEGDDASADCVRRRIEESMRRLDVDRLDFYQVWNIMSREAYDQAVARGGMVEGIQKAMSEGLVGHTGFTTHDTPENLRTYFAEADWAEIVLISYNMLYQDYAVALAEAHRQGIGTIVMNPVGGGKLTEPSKVLLRLADGVGAETVPELAIRYILSNASVDTIVAGISKQSDVDGAIAAAEREGFSEDEKERIDAFLQLVSIENTGFCTRCGYCMPCSQGVDIPSVMSCIYDDRFWGLTEAAKQRYAHIKGNAGLCTQCGQCLSKCTQRLPIATEMEYARKQFGATS